MPNRLANENSPYLLQHASNPVDWYPWGQEALEAARRQNKPIFLSIGYAACHWCHVMERESFEDQRTADLLNANFIAIKVDREQRPDLDSIYMQAAQCSHRFRRLAAVGLPDARLATVLRRHVLPARPSVQHAGLHGCSDAARPSMAGHPRRSGARGRRGSRPGIRPAAAPQVASALSPGLLQDATTILIETYDHEHGGWGRAPKFPQPMAIDFLAAPRGRQRCRSERCLKNCAARA